MIPGSTLLHIYDADDFSIDLTASVRRNSPFTSMLDRVHAVPVHGGFEGLFRALDDLVKDGRRFSRALFETHGSTGKIYFGGDEISGRTFKLSFAGRSYHTIFPFMNTRIYFNGCNVADEPEGWDFLDSAGGLFLRTGGGVTFAQTGLGRPIIVTGHVHHFGSSTSYSAWAPGGYFLGHVTD
jgi:hypothetical protein